MTNMEGRYWNLKLYGNNLTKIIFSSCKIHSNIPTTVPRLFDSIWIEQLVFKKLKFRKKSKQVLMCSIRTNSLVSKFQPYITIWKKWPWKFQKLTVKKLKFRNNSKQLLMCSIRTVLSKFHSFITILKRMTLKFSKIDLLTLKKLKLQKNKKK